MKLAAGLVVCAVVFAQSGAVVIPDLAKAKWEHDAKDGSDSVILQQDAKTGGMDLLVRYPAGHKLAPHWHSVTERMILLEGKLTLRVGSTESTVTPGGLTIAPPKEVHGFTCVSSTPCTFYIAWDGKQDTHKVQ